MIFALHSKRIEIQCPDIYTAYLGTGIGSSFCIVICKRAAETARARMAEYDKYPLFHFSIFNSGNAIGLVFAVLEYFLRDQRHDVGIALVIKPFVFNTGGRRFIRDLRAALFILPLVYGCYTGCRFQWCTSQPSLPGIGIKIQPARECGDDKDQGNQELHAGNYNTGRQWPVLTPGIIRPG